MSLKPLKLAVIGINAKSQMLLDAAWNSDLYDIIALADKRADHAQAWGRKYECEVFDDYRQLIIQNSADVLIAGDPIHLCADYIKLAIQNKTHVIKVPPPALSFEQMGELTRLAIREGVYLIVAQNGRYSGPFQEFGKYLHETNGDANQWHLISAVCHVPRGPFEPHERWLNDPSMAGGGVLLQDCYGLIDELILCFGLPQQVYAVSINQAPDRQQRLSLTEDTALVMMKFSDTLIAHIAASRTLGPARQHLRIHGKTHHITITPSNITVYDNTGQLQKEMDYSLDELADCYKMLNNFAMSLIDPRQNHLFPAFGADLQTMAVIESAYLSNRTGMPEDPSRLLDMARIDAATLR